MKILITGINGFVGKYLADYLLEQGEEVVGISRKEDLKDKTTVEIFQADLNMLEQTKRSLKKICPEAIVHLAAFSSVGKSFENPSEAVINNVRAQINLLESMRLLNLKPRVLVISSADIYGNVGGAKSIDESFPLKPLSPYAVSKAAQDLLGFQYYKSFGIPIIRLRSFNHIGPGQSEDFVVSKFARKIAEAERSPESDLEILVGNLAAIRDFTDVRDIVRAYYLAIKKAKAGEAYNIGSGRGIKIGDVLNRLLQMSTKKIQVKKDKSLFRPLDTPKLVSDSRKFAKVCLWRPEISFDTTLEEILNHWRAKLAS